MDQLDIREKAVITEAVDAMMAVARPLVRGDTLRHEVIEATIGVGRYEEHYGQTMNRFRRRFERERGITLWSERGVGFRLCTAEEQLRMVPSKRAGRARRQYRRARRSVEAVPASDMTPHQRKLRAFQLDNLRQAHRSASEALRLQEAFLKRPDTTASARVRSARAFHGVGSHRPTNRNPIAITQETSR